MGITQVYQSRVMKPAVRISSGTSMPAQGASDAGGAHERTCAPTAGPRRALLLPAWSAHPLSVSVSPELCLGSLRMVLLQLEMLDVLAVDFCDFCPSLKNHT